MSKPTSTSVTPYLQATADDIDFLRDTATALEDEVVAQYEAYLFEDHREIQESRWKPMKTDGRMLTFKERKKRTKRASIAVLSPTSTSDFEPQASLAMQSSVGRVLITGVVPGTVDDAMYGCSFHDTITLRTHEAYQASASIDSAVLLTIDSPTPNDPYRFLGVTWRWRSSLFSKGRDVMLLQQTRLTTLRSGERVGVSLRHSVKHHDVPEDHTLVSSVTIYRQIDSDHVEVFGIELLDQQGRTIDGMQRQESVRNLLLSSKVCETGFRKKLSWLIQQGPHGRPTIAPSTLDKKPKQCTICEKATSGMFSASGAACKLCAKHVCSQCTTTHNVVVNVRGPSEVTTKAARFCIECILLAKQSPTLHVAQAAFAARHSIEWNNQ